MEMVLTILALAIATLSIGSNLFGPLFIAIGLIALMLAVWDPGESVSKFFDSHKDWRGGIFSVSKNSVQFRVWLSIIGMIFALIGIGTTIASA
jgi:hypothetical protein